MWPHVCNTKYPRYVAFTGRSVAASEHVYLVLRLALVYLYSEASRIPRGMSTPWLVLCHALESAVHGAYRGSLRHARTLEGSMEKTPVTECRLVRTLLHTQHLSFSAACLLF